MTTQEELNHFRIEKLSFRIEKLSDAVMPMLSTVDSRDDSVECWIECINNNGEKVRLIPDKTGWQDNRKEIMVMNCVTGCNQKLFFTPGDYPQLHDITLNDSAAYQVMSAIPAAVLRWAILRAH